MTTVETLADEAREAGITPLEALLRRGRLRATLMMLGPAFVASVAYVDPGNFATNVQGGAKFGYLLLWVVLAANLMAMLIQYLSAKLGIVTDQNLPESFRDHYPRWLSWGMWVQAELISMSTDIAEFLGAALGLNLLFHVPLLIAGVITAFIAFGILELRRRGFRPFELGITALLGIIFLGFLYDLLQVHVDGGALASGGDACAEGGSVSPSATEISERSQARLLGLEMEPRRPPTTRASTRSSAPTTCSEWTRTTRRTGRPTAGPRWPDSPGTPSGSGSVHW